MQLPTRVEKWGSMSKRPPGGPDAEMSRGEIAGYRHAPHYADHGGEAAGSDEVIQLPDCTDCRAKR